MTVRKQSHDWTQADVQRFWDYQATTPRVQPLFFSNMVGAGIVNFLRLTGKLKGRVLDYGCGPGYLVNQFLSSALPIDCWGVDSSQLSVDRNNTQFQGHPRWRGAQCIPAIPTPFESQHFDVITCIETIEHLTDEFLRPILAEIRRLLRVGGIALFTTPHNEDLDNCLTYCPFCDAEFHSVQHVRSFTVSSLAMALEQAGFRCVFCQNIDLNSFQRPYPSPGPWWRLRGSRHRFADYFQRWQDQRLPRKFPNGREFQRLLIPGPHLVAVVENA